MVSFRLEIGGGKKEKPIEQQFSELIRKENWKDHAEDIFIRLLIYGYTIDEIIENIEFICEMKSIKGEEREKIIDIFLGIIEKNGKDIQKWKIFAAKYGFKKLLNELREKYG